MRLIRRGPIAAALAAALLLALAAPGRAQDGAAKPADPQDPPAAVPEAKPDGATPEEATPEGAKPDGAAPDGATPAGDDPEAKPAAETPAERRRRRRRPRLTPRLPKRTTTMDFTVGAFAALFDGSSRKDTPNSIGDRIEFDEISLDDLSVIVPVELQVHLTNRFTLLTDFFMHSASGSEVTNTVYSFDGVTFAKGATLESELSVISGSFAARYFASSSQYGTFEIEAGLRYLGIELEYSTPGGGKALETTDAFMPFVGFHGTVNLTTWQKEQLAIEGGGRVGVMAIGDSADNQTNAYLHAYVRLAVPLPFLSAGRFRATVTLGYEYMFLDAEREDDNHDEDFELLYHGPALGIVLSF